jgi:hypothetical protein
MEKSARSDWPVKLCSLWLKDVSPSRDADIEKVKSFRRHVGGILEFAPITAAA